MLANQAASVLGVAPTASQTEIRRAFRRRALASHPDRGGSEKDFIAVKRAYEVLLQRGGQQRGQQQQEQPQEEIQVGDWFEVIQLDLDGEKVPGEDLGKIAQLVEIGSDLLIALYLRRPVSCPVRRVDAWMREEGDDNVSRMQRDVLSRSLNSRHQVTAVWFSPFSRVIQP